MLCRREKESPSLQFRADRIFHATGGWYFHTREEIDVGPYTSRLDAEAEAVPRERAGLTWDGFGIQAQAQSRGGTPERWHNHAQRWRNLGCTHLAIVTHYCGHKTVDEHLAAAQTYFDAAGSDT